MEELHRQCKKMIKKYKKQINNSRFILIICSFYFSLSCGKKDDPEYKESKNVLNQLIILT